MMRMVRVRVRVMVMMVSVVMMMMMMMMMMMSEEDAIGAGSWDRESKFLQTRKGGSLQTRGSEISSST